MAFDIPGSERCNGIFAETVAIGSHDENVFSRKIPSFFLVRATTQLKCVLLVSSDSSEIVFEKRME